MPRANLPSGIEIEYETYGDPSDPTLLLVNGFTSQLLGWDLGLVEQFVDQGLHVVRYDNRDVGLSSKIEGGDPVHPQAVLKADLAGEPLPPVPYTLSDMAADGIGVLDELGVDRAHVAGASMGGMIVQTMAIEHPDRVASLCSIMSTPGMRFGRPTPEASATLLAPPPTDRDEYIEASLDKVIWCSNRYFDPARAQVLAAAAYDRSFYPEGSPRQLAAIYASGDRSDALTQLDVPTLVIHGRDDTLITPEGGERTAELVPGARYLLLSDMGHDFPEPLWPTFAHFIGAHTRAA